jgi:hypothetical protein
LKKELTCKELVEIFQDVYCEGTDVLIQCEHEGFILNICNTDHLQVFESDKQIIMQDDNDINLLINKSSISSTTLSDFEANSERIDLVCGTGGFSFILCN